MGKRRQPVPISTPSLNKSVFNAFVGVGIDGHTTLCPSYAILTFKNSPKIPQIYPRNLFAIPNPVVITLIQGLRDGSIKLGKKPQESVSSPIDQANKRERPESNPRIALSTED
jgi:hypothetical protein